MPIEFQKFIRRQDLQNNPNKIYVFGDNMSQKGLGGQAKEMRGEPNAFGIPTKWTPSLEPKAFFSDSDFIFIKDVWDSKFVRLNYYLYNDITVVWPSDGIGTGLSKLSEKAPKLHEYLMSKLFELE